MKLKYVGPQAAIFIPHHEVEFEVERDGVVDVPAELATELLKRPDFEAAQPKKKAVKATKETK
jgi:hypothetical protein